VTRAEFAAIINKAFKPASKRPASDFVDVSKPFWGYSAIQNAYQGGFLEGYSKSRFRPKRNISRVEALVSLASGLELKPEDLGVLSTYTDASQIPDYATPAILVALQQALTQEKKSMLDQALNGHHLRLGRWLVVSQVLVLTLSLQKGGQII
jgi:hypothetical protein